MYADKVNKFLEDEYRDEAEDASVADIFEPNELIETTWQGVKCGLYDISTSIVRCDYPAAILLGR